MSKKFYTAEEVARIIQGETDENYDEEEYDAEKNLFEVSSSENIKLCFDKTLINSVADKVGCVNVHSFEEGEFEHPLVEENLGSDNIVQQIENELQDLEEGYGGEFENMFEVSIDNEQPCFDETFFESINF